MPETIKPDLTDEEREFIKIAVKYRGLYSLNKQEIALSICDKLTTHATTANRLDD